MLLKTLHNPSRRHTIGVTKNNNEVKRDEYSKEDKERK